MFDQSPFDPSEERLTYGALGDRQSAPTVAEVIATLREGEDGDRELAALQLGQECFGNSFWLTRLESPGKEARARMALAVKQGKTGSRPRVLLPVLIQALDDPDSKVRSQIARALMTIGPVAVQACPRLRKALKDDDPEVRLWVARALYLINHDDLYAIEASVALLDDEDPRIRSMAACNLETMCTDAYAAMPFLEKRLRDSDVRVRRQARQALEAIRRYGSPRPTRRGHGWVPPGWR